MSKSNDRHGVALRQAVEIWDARAGHAGQDDETDDRSALRRWLSIAAHRNAHTFRSYSKEASRFWCFLRLMHQDNPARAVPSLLRDATEADVVAYESTLLGKAPSHVWPRLYATEDLLRECGLREQPFVTAGPAGADDLQTRALKPSSVNQAINILHAMYEFWMIPHAQSRQSYVGSNPVRRIKRSTVRAQRQSLRLFPESALHALMLHCDIEEQEARAQANQTALVAAARRRWLLCLLFGLWARRAEIAALRMNDFQFDGKTWQVRLQRKGGKEQKLPVADWVLDALMRYRASIGISGLPSPADYRPAVMRVRPQRGLEDRPLDPSTLYREVCTMAHAAARKVRSEDYLPELTSWQREHCAQALETLSPHWFRHTAASIAIESGALSLENASRVLGHSSTVVTSTMYYHPDDKQIASGLDRMGQVLGGNRSS